MDKYKIIKTIINIFTFSIFITFLYIGISFAQFSSIGSMYNNIFFGPLSGSFSINPLYGPFNYGFQGFGTDFNWPFSSMGIGSLNMGGYPFFPFNSEFINIATDSHNFRSPLWVPNANNIAGTGSGIQSIFLNGVYNPLTINNNPLSLNPLCLSTGLLNIGPSYLSGNNTPIMGTNMPGLISGITLLFVSGGTSSEYNEDEDDETEHDDGQTDTPFKIAAQEGGSEMAVDAPWRIEPNVDADGKLSYGAIPIQISIHDSDQLSCPGRRILELYSVQVTEYLPDSNDVVIRNFYIKDLHEIEITRDYWPWPDTGTPPDYELCRGWAGEDCSGFEKVKDTSEWHAILFYPVICPYTTEEYCEEHYHDVRLKVTLLTRAETYEWVLTSGGYRWVLRELDLAHNTHLNVHLGEAPLPRFDNTWAYGDLHYHAHGTDNDGESTYHNRGVIQAMSALGLDFAFATDHASNSEQIIDLYFNILNLDVDMTTRGLRDLSETRFAYLLQRLHAADGVNAQVASYPRAVQGGLAAPQLFQGAEVDIIPEVAVGDNTIGYGYAVYGFYQACRDLPLLAKTRYGCPLSNPICEWICDSILDLVTETSDGRWLVHDVQGKAELDYYARQHILHLPSDPDRTDAFVSSSTSFYGGATRRLREVLDKDYKTARKGYIFIAHPFDIPEGAGIGRLGPDKLPFDKVQLEEAFESEFILGLQLWSGNGHLHSYMNDGNAMDSLREFVPVFDLKNWQHKEKGSSRISGSLSKGIQALDDMNLWGLNPNRTKVLDWVPDGEPRRVFMAGGSDAHGDLSFHRCGAATNTSSVNDTALGNPRNLVHVGERQGRVVHDPYSNASGQGVSQEQLMAALRQGEFSVTDGPALRIALDLNGNGLIDASDVPMGGVHDQGHHCPFSIVVEWRSTPEFGGLDRVDIYLGLYNDAIDQAILWAPAKRSFEEISSWDPAQYSTAVWWLDEASGVSYLTLGDDYWVDPTGTLQFKVHAYERFSGRRIIRIDPADFPVGEGRTEWYCDEDFELNPNHVNSTSPDTIGSDDDDGAEFPGSVILFGDQDAGDTTMTSTTTEILASSSAKAKDDATTNTLVSSEGLASVDPNIIKVSTSSDGSLASPDNCVTCSSTSISDYAIDGASPTAAMRDNPFGDPFDDGDDIVDPPPAPRCESEHFFDNASIADRMFVRAVAIARPAAGRHQLCAKYGISTEVGLDNCIWRRAFTNPVWVLMKGPSSNLMCPPDGGFVVGVPPSDNGPENPLPGGGDEVVFPPSDTNPEIPPGGGFVMGLPLSDTQIP